MLIRRVLRAGRRAGSSHRSCVVSRESLHTMFCALGPAMVRAGVAGNLVLRASCCCGCTGHSALGAHAAARARCVPCAHSMGARTSARARPAPAPATRHVRCALCQRLAPPGARGRRRDAGQRGHALCSWAIRNVTEPETMSNPALGQIAQWAVWHERKPKVTVRPVCYFSCHTGFRPQNPGTGGIFYSQFKFRFGRASLPGRVFAGIGHREAPGGRGEALRPRARPGARAAAGQGARFAA